MNSKDGVHFRFCLSFVIHIIERYAMMIIRHFVILRPVEPRFESKLAAA